MNLPSRRVAVVLGAIGLIAILAGAGLTGPFQLGFGLPSPNGKLVRYVNTNTGALVEKPVSGTVFEWTYLDNSFREQEEWVNAFGVVLRGVYLQLKATLTIKIEVSALADPTEITDQVVIFKVAEDPVRNVTVFRRNEYHVFSYLFKVNYAWTGNIAFSETKPTVDQYCLTCPGVDEIKERLIKTLISRYNTVAYEKNTKLSWDLNAPSLATISLPSPGYVGIMGLFLAENLRLGGYANSGTAADISPQGEGTVVSICLEQYLDACPREAWNLGFPTPQNWTAPADFVYYPDHFATPYAYWTTTINLFGSTISFQRSDRNYPEWWSWAYQASGLSIGRPESCLLPCAAQWFRADVLTLTSEPFEVPNYALGSVDSFILVPDEPINLGTSSPPEQPLSEQLRELWNAIWNTARWVVIVSIILLALIVLYVVVKRF